MTLNFTLAQLAEFYTKQPLKKENVVGKLILTSGGYLDGQRSTECDEIIEEHSKSKRVLIVDNATTTGSNVYGLPVLRTNFSKIAKSVTQLTLSNENIKQIFDYDVLYITGGDTTPLIELINEFDLKSALVLFLESGGTIIGESAGSIIFGSDAKWYYDIKKGTKPKYDVLLPTYKCLGLTDKNIFPHWDKAKLEMQEKVMQYEKLTGMTITSLIDGEFIFKEFGYNDKKLI